MGDQPGKIKDKERTPVDPREVFRFVLAMTILFLFGMLLMATMAGGYTDPTVLAGMFSGWIVAIIGFYFMDEVSARSLSQETKRAVESQHEDVSAAQDMSLKQKEAVITDLKERIDVLSTNASTRIKEQQDIIMKLTKQVQDYMAYTKECSEMLALLGPKTEAAEEE